MDLLGLVQRAQTTGADLYLDRFAIAHQGLFVDVGLKPGLGMAVGVADIVAGHSSF